MRAALFSLLFLTSCGYHLGRGEVIERYGSVCIPYVEGDEKGLLTTALVRTMTTKGALAYRTLSSDLILRVCLYEPIDRNIGFTYAPEPDLSKVVVSNEARLTMTASVRLIDKCTGECVLGPCDITSSLAYDFEPDLSTFDAHAFSLGQLEMHNLALDAASPPLFTLLAEKIVDFVNHGW